MSAFDFKLQKVLNVRNIQEDIAQNEFVQARQKEREMKSELKSLKHTKKKTYDYIRNNSRSSIEETVQARKFLHHHKKKIDKQTDRLLLQQKKVAQKQEKMIEKQKKRKVLDKLKEEKYKKFYKNHLKSEQKLLDEIAQRSEKERSV